MHFTALALAGLAPLALAVPAGHRAHHHAHAHAHLARDEAQAVAWQTVTDIITSTSFVVETAGAPAATPAPKQNLGESHDVAKQQVQVPHKPEISSVEAPSPTLPAGLTAMPPSPTAAPGVTAEEQKHASKTASPSTFSVVISSAPVVSSSAAPPSSFAPAPAPTHEAPSPSISAPFHEATSPSVPAPSPSHPAPSPSAPAPSPSHSAAPKPSSSSGDSGSSSGSSGGSGGGLSGSGDLTFYTAPPGALTSCGETYQESEPMVAMAEDIMSKDKSLCGKEVAIHYEGKTTKAKIVDTCPGCKGGSIDLSPAVFKTFASKAQGRLHNAKWQIV